MLAMRRLVLTLLLAITASALTQGPVRAQASAEPQEAKRGPVLLELFTSQGCSACPPADKLLASLAPREDLIVLSFHVSYWDHMGWSDPFAIPASTRRQRGYARAMRSRSIYTPQMIIQGAAAAVGSDEARIATLVREAAPSVALEIAREMAGTERISVTIPEIAAASAPLELWAVVFSSADGRFVPQGENAGHMLQHANVVRHAGIVAVVERTPALMQFDRPDMAADGIALILQGRNLGPVVGTGRLSLR
jgi:hypothetical protein